jgi:hypothetical protein
MWLLEDPRGHGPGSPFGAPGYLRFSYACSEDDIVAGHRGDPQVRRVSFALTDLS